MRQINETEKKVLRTIIDYHKSGTLSNLASLLDPWLINKEIFLDFVIGTAEIHIDIHYYEKNTLISELKEIVLNVVTTIKLLEDLQRAGYVTLFLEAKPGWSGRYGQLPEKNKFISSRIEDRDVTRLLLDYSYKSIIVGQPLLDYIDNDFRTAEEKNSQFEIRMAIAALFLSILLSGIAIYYSVQEVKYSRLQVEREQTVRINQNQVNKIESKVDETNRTMIEINKKIQQLEKLNKAK
jgi:hypothetical protein